MRIYLFVLIMLCIPWNSIGQKQIVLWPNEVPGQETPQKEAEVSDNHSRDVTRLSVVTKPLLEVYVPEKSVSNGKAMIVCPGGGYNILAVDLEGYEVAEWLKDQGFHVFVLQYRVPGNRKGAFQDVQAQKFGLESWKVGVMGFSAGGHLSTRAATAFDEESYAPMDEYDKLDCRPDFAALIYPAYLDNAPEKKLSPEINLDGNIPPMFIFGTVDDYYGNSAIVMTQAMRDSKHDVEFHLYSKGGHGYGLRKGNPAADIWPELLEKWLIQIEK